MKYIRLFLVTIVLFINGCGSSSSSSDTPPSEQGVLKIACVGDSITQGYALDNPADDSYPSQLAQILGEGFQVGNFGIRSATVLKNSSKPYWSTSQFESSKSFNPDIVVIMLGTNDAKSVNWSNQEQFIPDYTDLINTYKNLESQPTVYIAYPPPAYGSVAGITNARILNEVIPKIQEVSSINNVVIIDNYTPLSGNSSLFVDTVHPNAQGAKVIAETVYQAIY